MHWDASIEPYANRRRSTGSNRIPVVAITGGWSPRFDAIGKGLAAYTSGQHRFVESGHHFPQLIEIPFNDALDALMRTAEETYAERRRYAT